VDGQENIIKFMCLEAISPEDGTYFLKREREN